MRTFISTIALLGLAVLACDRDRDRQGTTTTTGAQSVANEAAVQKITLVRCSHEAACNNVGDGKRFESTAACMSQLGNDVHAKLRAEDCPKGIDGANLDACITDIRGESCGNPVDQMNRILSCSKTKLCR